MSRASDLHAIPRGASLSTPPPIRLLFVSESAQRGGAEVTMLNILQKLDRNRFTPRVILLEPGPLAEEVARLHVPVATLRRNHREQVHKTLLSAWRIYRELRRHEIDVVHTSTTGAHFRVGLAAALARTPEIWHLHDPFPLTTRLERLIFKLYMAIPYAAIICSSGTSGDFYKRYVPASKLRMIAPAINLPVLHSSAEVEGVRRKLGIAADRQLVVTVARLQPSKGHHFLIDAIPGVVQAHPAATFVFIGPAVREFASYEQQLREQIAASALEHHVFFTGYCSNFEKECLVQAADVVVHPATFEPYGLAVIEAMALAKAVVASRIGGPRELITEGDSGLLVEPGDPQHLCDGICQLLSDPTRRQAIGERARARALSLNDVETMMNTLQDLYVSHSAGRRNCDAAAAPESNLAVTTKPTLVLRTMRRLGLASVVNAFPSMRGTRRRSRSSHRAVEAEEET